MNRNVHDPLGDHSYTYDSSKHGNGSYIQAANVSLFCLILQISKRKRRRKRSRKRVRRVRRVWRLAIADTLTIKSVEEELRGPRRCRRSWRARCVASRLVRQRWRWLHRASPSEEVAAKALSLLCFLRWKQKRKKGGHDVNLVCLCELRSEPSLCMYFIPFCFTQQENPERT